MGEFLLNFILNVINAQKRFDQIKSPADLEAQLLRGDTFKNVAGIDSASVDALYEMLAEYSPADSVLLKKPTVKKNLDPELRKLRQINERRNAPSRGSITSTCTQISRCRTKNTSSRKMT